MTAPQAADRRPDDNPRQQMERLDQLLTTRPNDPALWKAKAALLRQSGQIGQAREAFARVLELDPGDAQAFLDRAVMGLSHGDLSDEALALLDQSLRLRPGNAGALYWSAYCHLLMERFRPAADCLAQAASSDPTNPHYRFLMGWASRQAGDEKAAVEAFLGMAGMCAEVFNRTRDMTYLGHFVHALMASGRSSEARRVLDNFTDQGRGLGPSFHHPEYLPDTPRRIDLLRRLVGGRDLAILTYGPSIAHLERDIHRLAGLDICYFTFNEPVIEETILSRIDKRSDLFCITSPQVLGQQMPWLRQFMSRQQANMFFAHHGALEGLSGLGLDRAWLERSFPDRLLYFRSMQRHPPVPSDPLHFPPYNTLSLVLPLALLGRPRRVFLFGCDGVAASAGGEEAGALFHSTAFQDERIRRSRPDADQAFRRRWLASYDHWLRMDTHQFNFQVPVTLAWLSSMFQLDLPPIYNCSPNSAYQGFPKIGHEEALRMLGAGGPTGMGLPGLSSDLMVPGRSLRATVESGAWG